MASIRPIEGGSVHKIQSGQVIVDLCSVVKELVENSLDAGATSLDIRFKNNGLDSIEVQDNGCGILRDDYESVALKHYTSKLRSYEDLTALQTFGFRGEAISSLCALSKVHIVTARQDEAPKGARLEFETSGRLKGTTTVAATRGTTVVVETIFKPLPVRRQELEKNIKREYAKVLVLLQAYACISTNVRLSVSNVMGKKKAVVFSTQSNKTTRENIANVFGTKGLSSLISLDLEFEMKASNGATQGGKQVQVSGHVSKPIFGEGRQTPDRQMFFVNSRPCGLPQVAKAVNEVYKSYNLSQSPFIFANVLLDTNAYDVNVSPDKRTILLHDQGQLLESIKTTLTQLFESQQQTVPQSQNVLQKLPSYKPLTVKRSSLSEETTTDSQPGSTTQQDDGLDDDDEIEESNLGLQKSLINKFASRNAEDSTSGSGKESSSKSRSRSTSLSVSKEKLIKKFSKMPDEVEPPNDLVLGVASTPDPSTTQPPSLNPRVIQFNDSLGVNVDGSRKTASPPASPPAAPHDSDDAAEPELTAESTEQTRVEHELGSDVESEPEDAISVVGSPVHKSTPGPVQSAFDRMRPLRTPTQTATINIGGKIINSTIGSSQPRRTQSTLTRFARSAQKSPTAARFSNALRSFAAPGTQATSDASDEDDAHEPPDTGTQDDNAESDDESLFVSSQEDENNNEDNTSTILKLGKNLPLREEHEDSDGEYLDETAKKKKKEDAKVSRLILDAESRASMLSEYSVNRAGQLLKGGHKDATTKLLQTIDISVESIERQLATVSTFLRDLDEVKTAKEDEPQETTEEERLSLTVSKEDFNHMRITGQFNSGFIIAIRPARPDHSMSSSQPLSDEVFIIDQHASDEKYNFERLQATTVVQNQRLVHPQPLDLTAIEEEIILSNPDNLLKNGFLVSIDESGDLPIGKRCKLLSLPMSKEVTFSTRDLEELLALLADQPTSTSLSSSSKEENKQELEKYIIRPSKVRKMFAMRACRSSVMIGKSLNGRQMSRLVGNMGTMDKPWNCPHGRPTMRHLVGLKDWKGWIEGDGVVGMRAVRAEIDDEEEEEEEEEEDRDGGGRIDWVRFLGVDEGGGEEGVGEEEEEEEAEEMDEDDAI